MKITLTTEPEDITPNRAEKQFGYENGFSEAVKAVQRKAEGRWGVVHGQTHRKHQKRRKDT